MELVEELGNILEKASLDGLTEVQLAVLPVLRESWRESSRQLDGSVESAIFTTLERSRDEQVLLSGIELLTNIDIEDFKPSHLPVMFNLLEENDSEEKSEESKEE